MSAKKKLFEHVLSSYIEHHCVPNYFQHFTFLQEAKNTLKRMRREPSKLLRCTKKCRVMQRVLRGRVIAREVKTREAQ